MHPATIDAVHEMEMPQSGLSESSWIARALRAEERTRRDLERAKEAQARLFPREIPLLETLTYAGLSIPAAHLGGDYYDFLDLGRNELGKNRLGLVVADVLGKGLAAGLLMASLRASIHSQSLAFDLPDASERLLKTVNRVFYESSLPESYATLFFAEYEDGANRLRYVNCGHPAPLLIHADHTVTLLEPTCTVLGLFQDWSCTTAEVEFLPGDTLLLYTDGVTEALSEDGTEFGQERLLNLVCEQADLPVSGLLQKIVANLEDFMEAQEDDLTLVAARCRNSATVA